jgi:polyhydroxybutyrate depolymerase
MKYFLCILAFFAITATAQPQQKREHITVDGIKREFVIYIPQLANNNKLPVIISLHGRLGTGERMMGFADFRPIADREKFIVVCPDGINRSWNDGRATPAERKGVDDVHFIGELITYLINTYNSDATRIYVTGMSNGGFMASRLACELPNRVAAVAVVAASMDKDMAYHPTKPVPIMYIQGTKDPLVPYPGGEMKKGAGGEIYSHTDVLKLWADAGHCNPTPVIANFADKAGDGTSVIKEEYANPSTGVKIVGYTISNGGHTWPGGSQYMAKFIVGVVSHNLNACDEIWKFFKGYSLAK